MKWNYRKDLNLNNFKAQFNNNDNISNIKKIGKGTFEYIINGEKRIKLYETDIIIFKKNCYILNNGGFDSNLTINRINDNILHSYIYRKKGIWYYKDIRFFNGIKIQNKTGKVLNKSKAPKVKNTDKRKKRILKQIKAYTDKINKIKSLSDDISEDCFYCRFNGNNSEHLLSHLKEKYIMKSLILKALHKKGYNHPIYVYEMEKDRVNKRSSIIRAIRDYFKNNLL